jgi:hypothetical protein
MKKYLSIVSMLALLILVCTGYRGGCATTDYDIGIAPFNIGDRAK